MKLKLNWTAELTNQPESRVEGDTSVAGDWRPTHKHLAEGFALSAAQSYAEPDADGWGYDATLKSTVAYMPDGTVKPYEFEVKLIGREMGVQFRGTVTINGRKKAVTVW